MDRNTHSGGTAVVRLLGLVLLPHQFRRHASAAQLVMHGRPAWRPPLYRRRLAWREQQPFKGSVVAISRPRRCQAGKLSARHVDGNGGAEEVDDAGNFAFRATVSELKPQNSMDFAHG